MNADLVELGAILIGLYATGYAGGFMVYSMRRFFDQV